MEATRRQDEPAPQGRKPDPTRGAAGSPVRKTAQPDRAGGGRLFVRAVLLGRPRGAVATCAVSGRPPAPRGGRTVPKA
ncbi:hypothetical protein SAMN05216505_10487 [Streptomyces prasinopilosus]|uniref:Uncharacterized protein n=1 Tax=Streptomyces prasinopilosus TaxID=67344 RepID=A0A1G6QEV1_9ACTN|nr:hypothetical protein SAMN05216505_10487 [Streptomyces prasinopilosus]